MNLIRAKSIEKGWGLELGELARIWKGGCIIRAMFLDHIKKAYDRNPDLANLLVDPEFAKEIIDRQSAWRRVVTLAINSGFSTPGMSSSLAYFDTYRRERLPANLVQAQRDYFGAHTYERTDMPVRFSGLQRNRETAHASSALSNSTSGLDRTVNSHGPVHFLTSPSVANLRAIRVHVDENQKIGAVGIEDQFQQMAVGVAANVNFAATTKTDGARGFVAAGVSAGGVVAGVPMVVGGDPPDNERSDPGGYRRVQQIQPHVQSPMQLQHQQQISQAQFQQKQSGGFDLASPDSASSEGGIRNPLSSQRQPVYQEQIIQIQSRNNMIAANQAELKSGDQNANKIQMQQQVQESGYISQASEGLQLNSTAATWGNILARNARIESRLLEH
ncbi:hypothetical protein SASPL_142843 [Salvia splendens]|uniref:phosphogluconate dehydrogenase (NADP(+)-dependent, decarboxylating) n=1 Tax=Salvia splendens TaxID=180675 RepID=A0A8X8Z9R9_SALSN|nr:hypothetical protein SASPL_142843 [Salvia splendens]